MWKAIKYFFYKSYKFFKYEIGDNTPELLGVLLLTVLSVLIIQTIINILDLRSIETKEGLLIYFCILGFFSIIFYRKGKWKKIIKEFENESVKARKRGRILVVLITILIIMVFIFSYLYFIIQQQS